MDLYPKGGMSINAGLDQIPCYGVDILLDFCFSGGRSSFVLASSSHNFYSAFRINRVYVFKEESLVSPRRCLLSLSFVFRS